MDPQIFLDTVQVNKENKQSFLFRDFKDILVFSPKENIDTFLSKIENHLNKGYWLAGYFTYEFGYWLDDALKPLRKNFNFPLAWLGVCKKPIIQGKGQRVKGKGKDKKTNTKIANIKANITEKEYCSTIAKIKKYLEEGLTYQVNYTFKLKFDIQGDIFNLYETLKNQQPTAYSAFLNTGKYKILSLSPELFFRIKNNFITTRPMKGTLPLRDKDLLKKFKEDYKTRAENIMIVDLLRNDLGRIAKKGSIKTHRLFNVEKYPTLYQMTSTINARLKNNGFGKIIKAIYPCGSITGAPKIETMRLINKLEKEPRNIYTGAIGYIKPNNDCCFNVAIRTCLVDNRGRGELGIGGGIVFDSKPRSEYNEALLKSKFLVKSKTR